MVRGEADLVNCLAGRSAFGRSAWQLQRRLTLFTKCIFRFRAGSRSCSERTSTPSWMDVPSSIGVLTPFSRAFSGSSEVAPGFTSGVSSDMLQVRDVLSSVS